MCMIYRKSLIEQLEIEASQYTNNIPLTKEKPVVLGTGSDENIRPTAKYK
jgi:hypothetical protein